MKKLKANLKTVKIHKESFIAAGESTTVLNIWLPPIFDPEGEELLLVLKAELVPSLIAALKQATA